MMVKCLNHIDIMDHMDFNYEIEFYHHIVSLVDWFWL